MSYRTFYERSYGDPNMSTGSNFGFLQTESLVGRLATPFHAGRPCAQLQA